MEAFNPRRILAPTDLSEFASTTVRYAADLARRFEAELVVMHADPMTTPVDFFEAPVTIHPIDDEEVRNTIESHLQSWIASNLPSDVLTRTLVVLQTPVDAILTTAGSLDCDLVVMGTHGRTGWRRALLGSVTEGVMRDINRPLLTIRSSEFDPAAGRPISKILCPVNFSDVALQSIETAAVFARAFDAELLVLHVIESGSGEAEVGVEGLRDWVPSRVRDACWFRELVIHGHAAEQILDFAEKVESDLIVIGAQHRRFGDTTVIGTTSERITRHAPCPVLTVIRDAVQLKQEVKNEEEVMV